MDYQALYQQKLTTAAEAVKVVKSGDWVDYSWCINHPIELDKALAARQNELYDVKIRGGVSMWMPEIAKAEDAGEHFTWNSWHCSGVDRKIIAKGMGNVETMLGCGYNIYYAFLVKCPLFVEKFQKPKLSPMLVKERN